LLFTLLLIGCEEDKRFPIKIIQTKNGYYEWYYYSLITSDGPDYIDYIDENCDRTLIYKGHNIIDVQQKKGILFIECFECDTIEFNPFYKNQINIIQNSNYMDLAEFLLIKDSLQRNVKIKNCN
jgi:hypothetical protein